MSLEHYQSAQYIRNNSELKSVVRLGETAESTVLDFKLAIDIEDKNKTDRQRIAKEIALDICQFANTWGGVLLVGVAEEVSEELNIKVAKSFVNVENCENIVAFINDMVLPIIYPSHINISINVINLNSDATLLAINIFPLVTGIACVYLLAPPYTPVYPYRTYYGKKYMKPNEIESRMLSLERKVMLQLSRLQSDGRGMQVYPSIKKEDIGSDVKWDSRGVSVVLKGISENEYAISINGIDVNIPFSLTDDVWRTEKGDIGVLLKVGLIVNQDRTRIIFDL